MFLRVQAISGYNSHDHPTRRNDFAIAEMSQESISDEMLIKIFDKIGDRGGIGISYMGKFCAKFYQIGDRGGSGVAETSLLFCKKIQYM